MNQTRRSFLQRASIICGITAVAPKLLGEPTQYHGLDLSDVGAGDARYIEMLAENAKPKLPELKNPRYIATDAYVGQYIEMLEGLGRKGPVPLRVWADIGGIDPDKLT